MTYDEKPAWLVNYFRLTGSINLVKLTSAILNILVNLNSWIYNKNGQITKYEGVNKADLDTPFGFYYAERAKRLDIHQDILNSS